MELQDARIQRLTEEKKHMEKIASQDQSNRRSEANKRPRSSYPRKRQK